MIHWIPSTVTEKTKTHSCAHYGRISEAKEPKASKDKPQWTKNISSTKEQVSDIYFSVAIQNSRTQYFQRIERKWLLTYQTKVILRMQKSIKCYVPYTLSQISEDVLWLNEEVDQEKGSQKMVSPGNHGSIQESSDKKKTVRYMQTWGETHIDWKTGQKTPEEPWVKGEFERKPTWWFFKKKKKKNDDMIKENCTKKKTGN